MPHPPRNQPRPGLLRTNKSVNIRLRKRLVAIWTGLPLHVSDPVQIAFLPKLSAHRGKLLTGEARGTPVYAASFVRQRRLVLETALLRTPDVLQFIFVHELFHFAWVRLGNSLRDEYCGLLANEFAAKARGELGESSAVKKSELGKWTGFSPRSRIWRDYVCESFCDSAAGFFTAGPVHKGYKLGKTWTAIRRDWFDQHLANRCGWAV